MASTIALRRRIRSVKGTRQITKAMELVAASKMRRAQDATLKSRAYRAVAQQILMRLRELIDVDKHPLFETRTTIKTKLYVVVTSDRGLAGAYDSNVLRRFTTLIREDRATGRRIQTIVLGKKGAAFVAKLEDVEIVAAYPEFTENPSPNDVRPLLNMVTEAYANKAVDSVDVIYTDYKSSILQVVTVQRLLPAAYTQDPLPEDARDNTVIFEPSPQAVLNSVSKRLVEVQLWQDLLESQASEQSARMMAMKTASDNAGELIDDLTLEMNTARQASITQELAEIVGGAEAIA